MGDGVGGRYGREGNRVRRAESFRCWLQFVFTPGRLLNASGWCLWTYEPVVGTFSLGSFLVCPSVVEGNHSLMGGSADAFASLAGSLFLFFMGQFVVLPRNGCTGFFIPPFGACPKGLVHTDWLHV